MAKVLTAVDQPTEAEKVFAHRMLELMRAGYTEHQAEQLAEALYVDLHKARGLIESGCDHKTAFKILI